MGDLFSGYVVVEHLSDLVDVLFLEDGHSVLGASVASLRSSSAGRFPGLFAVVDDLLSAEPASTLRTLTASVVDPLSVANESA